MSRIFSVFIAVIFTAGIGFAQQVPEKVPVKQRNEPAAEVNSEKMFDSVKHRFRIEFTGLWTPAGDEFAANVSERSGIDLSLRPPEMLDDVSKAQMDKYLDRVTLLATAFLNVPGAENAAIVRISAEDLTLVTRVRDAVDYFDLMRSQFASMTLPPDMLYSETKAEKLGDRQYAYLDISTGEGKKRLYATVRGRHAIVFAVSYVKDADLSSFRKILSGVEFYKAGD